MGPNNPHATKRFLFMRRFSQSRCRCSAWAPNTTLIRQRKSLRTVPPCSTREFDRRGARARTHSARLSETQTHYDPPPFSRSRQTRDLKIVRATSKPSLRILRGPSNSSRSGMATHSLTPRHRCCGNSPLGEKRENRKELLPTIWKPLHS